MTAERLDPLSAAVSKLDGFTAGRTPKVWVTELERSVTGVDREAIAGLLMSKRVDNDVLAAAIAIKSFAGQINVLIHALGIMLALTQILSPGERVNAVSLGAGTGDRLYDLETDRRIAEFKFTRWRGQDAVRQRELFADFVALAESADPRKRQLFVAGLVLPAKFLHSNRSIASVCQRRPEVLARIRAHHGDSVKTVAEYAAAHKGEVELVDVAPLLPAFVLDIANVAADRGTLDGETELEVDE
jgi:hypothetical protein